MKIEQVRKSKKGNKKSLQNWLNGQRNFDHSNLRDVLLPGIDALTAYSYFYRRFGESKSNHMKDDYKELFCYWVYSPELGKNIQFRISGSYHEFVNIWMFIGNDESEKVLSETHWSKVHDKYIELVASLDYPLNIIFTKGLNKSPKKALKILENEFTEFYKNISDKKQLSDIFWKCYQQTKEDLWEEANRSTPDKFWYRILNHGAIKTSSLFTYMNWKTCLNDSPVTKYYLDVYLRFCKELLEPVWIRDVPINILGYVQ